MLRRRRCVRYPDAATAQTQHNSHLCFDSRRNKDAHVSSPGFEFAFVRRSPCERPCSILSIRCGSRFCWCCWLLRAVDGVRLASNHPTTPARRVDSGQSNPIGTDAGQPDAGGDVDAGPFCANWTNTGKAAGKAASSTAPSSLQAPWTRTPARPATLLSASSTSARMQQSTRPAAPVAATAAHPVATSCRRGRMLRMRTQLH